MKIKSFLLLSILALAGCVQIPNIGIVEVPIKNPPIGYAVLGRTETPAPGTIVGFRTLPGGSAIGSRVDVISSEDQVWLKIYDEPLSE